MLLVIPASRSESLKRKVETQDAECSFSFAPSKSFWHERAHE